MLGSGGNVKVTGKSETTWPFHKFINCKEKKKCKTIENKRKTGVPQNISSRTSKKFMHRTKQNSIVAREMLQDHLFSSEIFVTKRAKSNEFHGSNRKSRSPRKSPLQLKRHTDAWFNCVHENKDKENLDKRN